MTTGEILNSLSPSDKTELTEVIVENERKEKTFEEMLSKEAISYWAKYDKDTAEQWQRTIITEEFINDFYNCLRETLTAMSNKVEPTIENERKEKTFEEMLLSKETITTMANEMYKEMYNNKE